MLHGLGQHALARRLRVKAVARARALGAAGTLAWALRSLALDEIDCGRFAWAGAYAAEGLQLALEAGQPNLACQHRAFLAEIAAIRGPEDEARRLGEEVLAEATARGLHGTVAFARRALVQLALATGRPDDALVQLEAMWTLGAVVHRGLARHSVPDLVEAAVRAGRPELGAERLPRYLPGRGRQVPRRPARWPRVPGPCWPDRTRRTRCSRRACGCTPPPTSRCSRPGRPCCTASSCAGTAAGSTRAGTFTSRPIPSGGSAPPAGPSEPGTNCGPPARPSAEPRQGPAIDRLTHQELQVARAVSQGLTNREAAAQLFISPRTVDHHLRSIYRKFGITSRAELVLLAGQLTGS